MSKNKHLSRIFYAIIFSLCATCFHVTFIFSWVAIIAVLVFFAVNIFVGSFNKGLRKIRLRLLNHGTETLIVFLYSVLFSTVYYVITSYRIIWDLQGYLISLLICIAAHIILFSNGIIFVYCTSIQLGVKQRIIGAICGTVPILNLFMLRGIIKTCLSEVEFEAKKESLNLSRKNDKICKTKYPILLVHGVFFRDSKYFCYWGRIPKELKRNGADIYFGNHSSALSVKDSANELAERIEEIITESGVDKVNIIAHSKGGLDCRYAIEYCEIGKYVASLTTVNTPHRGCIYAEYLLNKAPKSVQRKIEEAYNKAAKKLGDTSPDFMAAVKDLCANACIKRNESLPLPDGIFCQSIGSALKRGADGGFPLRMSYPLVKHFDGSNDGLVCVDSFSWGEKYTFVDPDGKRGISHMEMTDLYMKNIPEFDVREFYVNLVQDLKCRGL